MKKVKVTIKDGGSYTLEVLEGTGTSCVEQTKDLELLLGGVKQEEGKKPEFYNPDLENQLFESFN